MAIDVLWMDGAEHYSTTNHADIDDIMTDGLWADAQGVYLSTDFRTGAYSFRQDDSVSHMRRTLGGDFSRIGLLFSVNLQFLPVRLNAQWTVAQFRNGANRPIISIQITPSGRVRILGFDNTELAISTREVAAGYHNFFEVKMNVATGVSVRINDNSAFTVTASGALDSYPGAVDSGATNLPAAMVHFGEMTGSLTTMANGYTLWDDIAPYSYEMADDATWLGLYGVYYLKPNADGTDTDWLKSTGSVAYTLVNSIAPDGDTAFIYTPDPNDKTSFPVEPLPTNITSVQAVAPVVYGRKTDSGPGSVQIGVLSGATEELNGDNIPFLTDYGFFQAPFQLDPDTAAAWSPTDLPEIVVKRTV